jgi:hypothetical protein
MLKSAPADALRQRSKRRSRHTLNKRAWQSNACVDPARRQPAGHPMIRFLLRFLGLVLLATAFVLFVYDGTKSIANQQLFYSSVDVIWASINQDSLKLVQGWIEQKALWAWDPYMQKFFDLPTSLVLAIIAAILVMLGRKKKRLIGYARD